MTRGIPGVTVAVNSDSTPTFSFAPLSDVHGTQKVSPILVTLRPLGSLSFSPLNDNNHRCLRVLLSAHRIGGRISPTPQLQ